MENKLSVWEQCRYDLYSFAKWACIRVYCTEFYNDWYLKPIFRAYEDIIDGRIKRLAVITPPRLGKSFRNEVFVAYSMGLYPHSKYLILTAATDLAGMITNNIKNIVQHPEYLKIFPQVNSEGVSLHNLVQKKKLHFTNIVNGYVKGVGIHGQVLGFGAGGGKNVLDETKFNEVFSLDDDKVKVVESNEFGGALIFDDTHTLKAAKSEVTLLNELGLFGALISRKNNANVPMIAVGQTINPNDLLQNCIKGKFNFNEKDTSKVIVLPALSFIYDNKGKKTLSSINKRVYTLKELLTKKNEQPLVFRLQFMQDPTYMEGSLIDIKNFCTYDKFSLPSPNQFKRVVIGLDLADSKHNDYTAAVAIGLHNSNNFYILDVARCRLLGSEKIENFILPFCKRIRNIFPFAEIDIPKDSGSGGLIQLETIIRTLAQNGIPMNNLIHYSADGNTSKVSRVEGFIGAMQKKSVFIPAANIISEYKAKTLIDLSDMRIDKWREIYLNELKNFTKDSKHDDMVDATARAYNRLMNITGEINDLYKFNNSNSMLKVKENGYNSRNPSRLAAHKNSKFYEPS